MEMQELVRLIDSNDCPACGPQKLILATRVTDIYQAREGRKICICCGRVYHLLIEPGNGNVYHLAIESMPPIAGQEYPYTCAVDHPEHKWPVDYDNEAAEPKTEEEKNQVDGQAITESPYEIEISSDWLADLIRQGSRWSVDAIEGPSPEAKIVSLSIRTRNNEQSVVLEYDRPVPAVMLEHIILIEHKVIR